MALNIHALVNTPGHPLTANEVLEAHQKVETSPVKSSRPLCESSMGSINSQRNPSSHINSKKGEKLEGAKLWLRLLDSY